MKCSVIFAQEAKMKLKNLRQAEDPWNLPCKSWEGQVFRAAAQPLLSTLACELRSLLYTMC